MPIYEFECSDCGEYFEALVRDSKPVACPGCHSQNLEQLLSMFSVSSAASRQSSIQGARHRNMKSQRDKVIADQEEVQRHRD